MSATAEMIATVRRMTSEPDDSNGYTDAVLTALIENEALIDYQGIEPHVLDYSTVPPSVVENSNWIPTYDLHGAAESVWLEKAGTVSQDYNFQADGGRFDRSQVADSHRKQAEYHRSRRAPQSKKSIVLSKINLTQTVIANLPEPEFDE